MRDWQERDLERFVTKHPSILRDALSELYMHDEQENEYPFVVLGTQIPCDFGKIDMLCAWSNRLYVVEFKAVMADEKAVGQTMRYVHSIQHNFDPRHHLASRYPHLKGTRIDWEIIPVIVAPSFSRPVYNCDFAFITAIRDQDNGSFSLWFDDDAYALDPRFEENQHAINTLLEPFAWHLIERHVNEQ